MDSGNAIAYYQRGLIYEMLQKYTMAKQDFEKAQALDASKAEYKLALLRVINK